MTTNVKTAYTGGRLIGAGRLRLQNLSPLLEENIWPRSSALRSMIGGLTSVLSILLDLGLHAAIVMPRDAL